MHNKILLKYINSSFINLTCLYTYNLYYYCVNFFYSNLLIKTNRYENISAEAFLKQDITAQNTNTLINPPM